MSRTPSDPFAKLPAGTCAGAPEPAPADDFVAEMPAGAPLPGKIRHIRHGEASKVWQYRDAAGALLFAVARFETKAGKEVLPYTFGTMKGRRGWHWKAPPQPRPLFGLDALASRPDAPVIVTEGEKAAEAAAGLFAGHVTTTSPSGAAAARLADWSVLQGRQVIVWPDADAAGHAYAADVSRLAAAAGAGSVRVVSVPDDWPEGWDLADAPPPGIDVAGLRHMLAGADPGGTEAAPLPPGFHVRGGSLFVRADDPEKPDVCVCGKLSVVASTHDGSGEDWGVLLNWCDDDGRLHEWAMPRALLAGDGTELRGRLLRSGLIVETGRRARDALATYLMRSKPAARVRIVSHLGWHETRNGRAFILPGEVIASQGDEVVRLQTERPEVLPPVKTRGTLAEWQNEVAAVAVGNSRIVLAISMAFAAPLLGLVNAEGGGVHLKGNSSLGKSTAAIAAGSVWGGGGLKGWQVSWRSTDNGLEAIAAAHCDLLLTLDELSEADPHTIGQSAYMLANGMGKNRASRDGGRRKSAEWRLLFLSSGEISVADKIAEAAPGHRAAAGQGVRVLEIPADAGGGFGLFEDVHGAADGAAFADRIQSAASAAYGSAGLAFLRRVIDDVTGTADAVRGYRAEFVARHVLPGADGQVARVAARFGLIAAGGELAVALGILPWPPGEATRALGKCFMAWRQARGGDGPAELTAGLAQVRRYLEMHGEGRFRRLGDSPEAPKADGAERLIMVGFRRLTEDGTEFFILPESWKSEVAKGFDAAALAKEMVRLGYLRPDSDGKPARRGSLPGRTKGARAYNVLPAIFADPAEG